MGKLSGGPPCCWPFGHLYLHGHRNHLNVVGRPTLPASSASVRARPPACGHNHLSYTAVWCEGAGARGAGQCRCKTAIDARTVSRDFAAGQKGARPPDTAAAALPPRELGLTRRRGKLVASASHAAWVTAQGHKRRWRMQGVGWHRCRCNQCGCVSC